MKIIFDSEEQKEAFFKLMSDDYCPSTIFLSDIGCTTGHKTCECEMCWECCGIVVEVRE